MKDFETAGAMCDEIEAYVQELDQIAIGLIREVGAERRKAERALEDVVLDEREREGHAFRFSCN